MTKIIDIRPRPLDYDFRKYTTELIRSARKEIHVVTGEFSIYHFADVEEAFHDAIRNGVSVKAYLGKCDSDTISKVLYHGMTVYPGERRPDKHFIVADRKHWIESVKHKPYSIGKRHGVYMIDDEVGAAEKIKQFEKKIKKIDPITKPAFNDKIVRQIKEQLYSR